MDNAELEVALEELESRLERLRALYEQYFMGIERIEPAIPRKDIDRRIYVLRREKIRNTAKRFKLQTIISRYNTFQQYWQRICREIEQGTYKRHVIKAERIAPGKLLTIAARKRLGRAALEAMEPSEGAEPTASPGIAPEAASVQPTNVVTTSSSALAEPTLPGRIGAPPKPLPPAKPKPGARPARVEPASEAPPAFESLNLDMDFLGDWDPSAGAAKAPAAPRAPADVPSRPFGKPLSRPLNMPPAVPVASSLHAKNGASPNAASLEISSPPAPRGTRPGMGPDGAAKLASAPLAPLRSAVAPPKPDRALQKTGAPPRPVTLGSAAPPKPVAVPPRPRSSAPPNAPPVAAVAQPAPPPVGARPLAAPLPGSAPPKPLSPKAALPKAPPAAALAPDERVRELHARLIEAKRQTQDGATVSLEGLAKSMKATEAKLREVHKNRKIDFDVVIKDGKAVLKPIVR